MDKRLGLGVFPIGRVVAGGTLQLLGTCFAVGGRKFATAAHVIGPSDSDLRAIVGKVDDLDEFQDTTDSRADATPLKIVNYNPVYDIAILELVDEDVRIRLSYSIGSADAIGTGSRVTSFGYPHADTGRFVLTLQSSFVGAKILLGDDNIKLKHVVLNTQTRPGQSGGPVFNSDGTSICAMITGGYAPAGAHGTINLGGVDPQTLHQTTHAVSAEYILEML